ncbi:3-oxoacyl-ACP synthase [Myxococcus eversor]|uniref:3-oxoacyl-ACP synthase n=1 Tax=Myxococcus eversor TaxID=2709661 RepID=UPI0013D6B980|nr:3-oxoacyl-ACP synthase [Myxococcus eversor]
MAGTTPLAVVEYGMVTAVGFNGPATCAAMRAGISGIHQANLWDFTIGEWLSAGRPPMPQWWEGPDMLPELLAPAIAECQEKACALKFRSGPVRPGDIPILTLVAPPDRPHRASDLETRVARGLAHKLGGALPPGSEVIPEGRTGLLTALDVARKYLDSRRVQLVIIAGVESFLRQVLVEHYIQQGRLLCGTNSNGFIPGEAACAVVVSRASDAQGPRLVIAGVGEGHEPGQAGGTPQSPVTGDGLTKAMRTALSAAGTEYHQINTSLSDLNGERFKFKERTIATGRLDRLPPSGKSTRPLGYVDEWHPIEYLGEIGSAVFPCLLGWAFEAGRTGHALGAKMMLFSGEDQGTRAAVVTMFEGGKHDER